MRWRHCFIGALWATGLAGLVPLAHSVSDTPRDYAAQAPVQAVAGEGLQRIVLPLAVLQRSRSADLADLRVFNAEGQAVPIAMSGAPSATEAATRSVPVPRFVWPTPAAAADEGRVSVQVNAAGAVVRVEGGALPANARNTAPRVWLLDVSKLARDGEHLAALQLDWPVQPAGVSTVAEVESSGDASVWRALTQSPLLETAAPAPASGVASQAGVERKRIELPALASGADRPKYLRLSLGTAVPLTQVRAELRSAETRPPLDSARFEFRPVAPDTGAPREWLADLQGPLPLQRIQLHLPQANALGSFVIERRAGEQDRWQHAVAVTAYRLVREGREAEAPPVELDGSAMRHWRLRLLNGTPDIGVGAVQADVFWAPRQLVFAARGGSPFQLAVGRDAAVPVAVSVVLPLATLVPGHRAGDEFKLPAATLGPVQIQVLAPRSLGEQLADSSPADRRKWLLWAVLAIAVVGLAWLARRLMHDMKHDKQRDTKAVR